MVSPVLKITRAQLDAFRPARRAPLGQAICDHLNAKHPELVAGLEPMERDRWIEHVLDEGAVLGLSSDRGYGYLAAMIFAFGSNFARVPEVADLVKGKSNPDEALLELPGRLNDAAWARVRKQLEQA